MKTNGSKLACSLVLTALAVVPRSAARQPFSVTLEVPSKPLKAGTELRLQVTVKNISDRDMTFIRSVSYGVAVHQEGRYKIHVVNSKEQAAPPSAWVMALKQGRRPVFTFDENHARTLKPGESFVDEINITRYYDLGRPGVYTIWVRRPMPPKMTSYGVEWPKGSVRSNTISVTVVK